VARYCATKLSAGIGVQLRPLFFHDLALYSSHPSLTTRRCKSGSHCQQANLGRHVIRVSISRILNNRLTSGFRAEVFNLSSSNHRIIVQINPSFLKLVPSQYSAADLKNIPGCPFPVRRSHRWLSEWPAPLPTRAIMFADLSGTCVNDVCYGDPTSRLLWSCLA
jgi:hypothetical protein